MKMGSDGCFRKPISYYKPHFKEFLYCCKKDKIQALFPFLTTWYLWCTKSHYDKRLSNCAALPPVNIISIVFLSHIAVM